MTRMITYYQTVLNRLHQLHFIPLLAIRLYLAPVFIMAGYHKYANFESMVAWFSNSDWGLGLPFASLLVTLTIVAELVGGIALLLGVFVRGFSLMLLVAMAVAMIKVHWHNGWHAVTPTDPNTSIAQLFSFSQAGQDSLQNSIEAGQRLHKAKEILQTHGNFEWLTEMGNFVILNNGIEFGMTYFIMLLVLLCLGAGRFVSIDDWIKQLYQKSAKR